MTFVAEGDGYGLVDYGLAREKPSARGLDLAAMQAQTDFSRSRDAGLTGYDYIRDGAEIYKNSFAIIRREADLARFDPSRSASPCASSTPAAWWTSRADLHFSPGAAKAGIAALARRRADPVRRQHGGPWRHARAPAERTTR